MNLNINETIIIMLWFIIHHFLQLFSFMENQNRNLTTFLTGTVLYVLFYSYVGSLDLTGNAFFKMLFGFFYYIVMADGFAMAIIYKNFYKQTIFTEVRETFGNNGVTMTAENVEPIVGESEVRIIGNVEPEEEEKNNN